MDSQYIDKQSINDKKDPKAMASDKNDRETFHMVSSIVSVVSRKTKQPVWS
jgi:hypothetical protein